MEDILHSKRLHLVLDLDHTLLHTKCVKRMTEEEKYLKSQAKSDISEGEGSLFVWNQRIIKLRPFVRTFLREASKIYLLHIYTIASRPYALKMVNILDPKREYIKGSVVSRDDAPQKLEKTKTLDMIPAPENAILILDDTNEVWRKHERNLIEMEKYNFFSSSDTKLNPNCKSFSEMKSDESETEGSLAASLKLLEQIHSMFYDESRCSVKVQDRDVRQVWGSLCNRSSIYRVYIEGLGIVLTTNFMSDQKKRRMCATTYDASVKHVVVSSEIGTTGSWWAVKENKFPVTKPKNFIPYLIQKFSNLCTCEKTKS